VAPPIPKKVPTYRPAGASKKPVKARPATAIRQFAMAKLPRWWTLSATHDSAKEYKIEKAAGGALRQNAMTREKPKLFRRMTGKKKRKLYKLHDPPIYRKPLCSITFKSVTVLEMIPCLVPEMGGKKGGSKRKGIRTDLHSPRMPCKKNILHDLPSNLSRLGITALCNKSGFQCLFLVRGKEFVALRLRKIGQEEEAGDGDGGGDGALDDKNPAPSGALWFTSDLGKAV